MTPAKAVERLRVEAARPLIEAGLLSFDEIGRLVGFNDPDRMAQSFVRTFGHTPQEMRRIARRRTLRSAQRRRERRRRQVDGSGPSRRGAAPPSTDVAPAPRESSRPL
ncbi:helix-turn-helix domain-containing protein (plasmid) [Ensifer adhaerens]|uniref:helix-turn-helix domain-containing protein n=1 Tax=Ensifer adhaerens TaxID=106592 RepID=UPI0023A98FA0|nr:helix-turn-helix domain-containing protein [Ensifer adhaerens]WDZ79056.1 helix-turn-helix domain-containing protein [Ensifer adhaerens]